MVTPLSSAIDSKHSTSSERANSRLLEDAKQEVHRLTAALRERDETIGLLQQDSSSLQSKVARDTTASLPKNTPVLRTLSDHTSEEKSSKETAVATTAPQKEPVNRTADSPQAATRNELPEIGDDLKQRLETATQDLRAKEEEIAKLKSALAAVKSLEPSKQKPQLSGEEKSIRAALTPSLQRKLDDTIRHRGTPGIRDERRLLFDVADACVAVAPLVAEGRPPRPGAELDHYVGIHATARGRRDTPTFRRQLLTDAAGADRRIRRYWHLTTTFTGAAVTTGAAQLWLFDALTTSVTRKGEADDRPPLPRSRTQGTTSTMSPGSSHS